MTHSEYVEMVSYIEDRWGVSNFWAGVARLYGDFKDLDTDKVYEVLLARTTGDPERARFAPKPAELLALTRDLMRHTPPPKPIPETTGQHPTWAEYSLSRYGEVIPLIEAAQRRHLELTGGQLP